MVYYFINKSPKIVILTLKIMDMEQCKEPKDSKIHILSITNRYNLLESVWYLIISGSIYNDDLDNVYKSIKDIISKDMVFLCNIKWD